MSGNGNNDTPWGPIDEIDAETVPPIGNTAYWDLFLELKQATEDMDPTRAKVMTFTDMRHAQAARTALAKYFKDAIPTIALTVRKADGGKAKLYLFYERPPAKNGHRKSHVEATVDVD